MCIKPFPHIDWERESRVPGMYGLPKGKRDYNAGLYAPYFRYVTPDRFANCVPQIARHRFAAEISYRPSFD